MQAEKLAARRLRKQGFRIVARNVRFYRSEIDIVAAKAKELHFVEVKARRGLEYGAPAEAVSDAKLRKMHRAAELFLKRFPEYRQYDLKFDILGVFCREREKTEINFIEGVRL